MNNLDNFIQEDSKMSIGDQIRYACTNFQDLIGDTDGTWMLTPKLFIYNALCQGVIALNKGKSDQYALNEVKKALFKPPHF